jgi:hypothetical protein
MDGIHVFICIGVRRLGKDLCVVGGGHGFEAAAKFVCFELAQLALLTIL